MKKILSVFLMGLSSAMLIATPLVGEEKAILERVEMGTRVMSAEERLALEAARANQDIQAVTQKKTSLKAAKMLSRASVGYTFHPGAYHNMVFASPFGETLELEDNSVWEVRLSDVYKVVSWLPSDVLVISPNHSWFSSYQYVITNQQSGDAIAVNLFLQPICRGPYTHWIVGIDYYNHYIYLEDGTVWIMSAFDNNIVYRWMTGDCVLIGINDGCFSSSNPNILINVNTLDYASGLVIY